MFFVLILFLQLFISLELFQKHMEKMYPNWGKNPETKMTDHHWQRSG